MTTGARSSFSAARYTTNARISTFSTTASSASTSACLNSGARAGRILRNLILGANYLQSQVLHFYHLAALDYIDTTGLLPIAPWIPRYQTSDMLSGAAAADLVAHYVQALDIRRKAHQMGAIFGGKLPCSPVFAAGGCTENVTGEKIDDFRSLLEEIAAFVRDVLIPDVELPADRFAEYLSIGRGCGNLLAYGAFDTDATGSRKLLRGGTYTDGRFRSVDPRRITEYVRHSHFTAASGNLNPAGGETVPQFDKPGAYSWTKAPRYMRKVHEVGPLARMWISGKYRRGISTMDRLMARALEARVVADGLERFAQGRLRTDGSARAGTARHAGGRPGPASRAAAGRPFFRPVPGLFGPRRPARAQGKNPMNRTVPPAARDAVPPAARDAVPPAARDAVPPAARDAVPPAARDAVPPRLILGIGNILLRDEGVGVRVVEAMQHVDLPGDVELVDGGTASRTAHRQNPGAPNSGVIASQTWRDQAMITRHKSRNSNRRLSCTSPHRRLRLEPLERRRGPDRRPSGQRLGDDNLRRRHRPRPGRLVHHGHAARHAALYGRPGELP